MNFYRRTLQDKTNFHGQMFDNYTNQFLKRAEDNEGLNTKLSFNNDWGDLESLAFHEDKVKELVVFRSEFDGYMGLFCQESFKLKVEALGLQGIIFSEDLGNIFPPDPNAATPTAH